MGVEYWRKSVSVAENMTDNMLMIKVLKHYTCSNGSIKVMR